MPRQHRTESLTAELNASIRMDHQSLRRFPSPYGPLQGLYHRFMTETGTDAPTDNQTRKKVDKNGQIKPADFTGQIRDVRYPDFIGTFNREPPVQKIRRKRNGMVGIGRFHPEFPAYLRPQSLPFHTAGNSFPVTSVSSPDHLIRNLLAAVSTTTCLKNRPHFKVKPLAFHTTPALRAIIPCIKTARRYLQRFRHPSHRKLRAMSLHEPVSVFGVFEKMATAFFKISRSCRAISSSRLS